MSKADGLAIGIGAIVGFLFLIFSVLVAILDELKKHR